MQHGLQQQEEMRCYNIGGGRGQPVKHSINRCLAIFLINCNCENNIVIDWDDHHYHYNLHRSQHYHHHHHDNNDNIIIIIIMIIMKKTGLAGSLWDSLPYYRVFFLPVNRRRTIITFFFIVIIFSVFLLILFLGGIPHLI